MGLFRKSKTEQKTDPGEDDPIYSELKRYREERRQQLGGGPSGAAEGQTTAGSVVNDPDFVPSQVRSPSPTFDSPPPAPSNEYQCSSCSLKFKESWNRCPKCGGDVVPIGLDQPEDMKKLYPEPGQRSVILPGAPRSRAAHTGGVRTPSPPSAAHQQQPRAAGTGTATSAKKVRKVKKPGDGQQTRKRADTPSSRKVGSEQAGRRSTALPPHGTGIPKTASGRGSTPRSQARQKSGGPKSSQDLDALFDSDPILDDPNIRTRDLKPAPKRSWKNVSPILETAHHTPEHRPPPEVRSMLNTLMDTGHSDPGAAENDGSCPHCGFMNPEGNWEFCMKCGTKF